MHAHAPPCSMPPRSRELFRPRTPALASSLARAAPAAASLSVLCHAPLTPCCKPPSTSRALASCARDRPGPARRAPLLPAAPAVCPAPPPLHMASPFVGCSSSHPCKPPGRGPALPAATAPPLASTRPLATYRRHPQLLPRRASPPPARARRAA
nr:non-specific lipid transfer protein GPI-anchored 23-like [Aegilops tauschii subsp. strangulata]